MCFLRQCCTDCLCPTLWPLCPKTGFVLAMQPLCRSHDWTVVNHYYTQNWGLTMCFLRQCCTHSLCRTLWPLCPKTGSVLAMQPLCRSHGWTVVNHYYTQNWGLTMCFLRQCCTHSLCPKLWPLARSWPCPTLWPQCSKTGSVLAMQPLCRSHDWTVVNHYCTQNWGLTMCFLRQCCTHSLCPTLWPLCPKTGSVLAMQPLCRSHGWTVVNHYCTQNRGLTMCFLRQCCTHSLCPTLWSQCSKTGSVLAMQPLCRSHDWTVVNHYCTQNWGLTMCFLRQCCTHSLCPTLWSQCSKTGSVLAMQPLCRSHGWTVVNHYCTQNRGLTMCFLRQCCTDCLCPTLWPLCPKTGSVLAMQPLCRSHDWTVVNHCYTQNWGLTMCFLRQCCTHSLCPTLWSQCSKAGSVLDMQPLCRSHGWTVVNHYCTQNRGLTMFLLPQCCTHSLCPTLWSQCSKTGSVLAMQPLCRSHGWTVVNHYCTQNWGLTMCFLRQCCTHSLCPTLWPLCPKTGSVLAMQPLCRSHDWTVVNHYCTQNWGLTMCFLRQCCTHCWCPTLWSQCSKTGSVLAMQPLCRSHGWTVVNHYCTQNRGLTMCFLRQCCTDCLCPTLWPLCPKTGFVLAMQPLCRSHDWTVVNHYYTQNWGLTMGFLRQCCTHSLCRTLWPLCPKTGSVLAMQPLCRSHGWTVVNHYYTQNRGLTMCFLRQCCTHSLCPTLWPPCPKTGSVLAMQPLCRSHDWTVVNHYCTQNWGLTMCFLRQCCTHSLCPTLWSQCSKTGSVLAMQPLCRSHGWTVVNHYCTQNRGLTMCFLRQCCTHSLCPTLWPLCPKTGSVLAMQPLCRSTQFVPHIVVTMLQNWLGLGHAAFVQKSWLDCGKSLLHTKQGSHHVFFAAMLHSQFVPQIVATVPQNWLGLGHAAFVQKS